MGLIRRHLSYANVVASIALFIALGGGAYAVVGNGFLGRSGTVRTCIQSADHELQVITPDGRCRAGSIPLALNQKGQRGPRGATGPRGRRGLTGSAATPPSYIDAYTDVNNIVCGGCHFSFTASDGTAGVQSSTLDIRLGTDNATFTLGTQGTYLVTTTVGPAGPVQLEVNGTRVGPNETSCGTSGTSMCAFQRILTLQTGSTIRLVNTTSEGEHEDPGSGITIVRIA